MKKFIAWLLLSSSTAWAGLPPTTGKSNLGTSSVMFQTQAPFYQLTKTSSTAGLVETGNVNILKNPGMEATSATSSWTGVGASPASVSTFGLVGSGSKAISWDSSAASQTLTSDAVAIPAGDYGANYEVSANLECGSDTCTHLIQAFDGTNVVASQTIISSLSYTRSTLNFVAPSSGNLSARIVSVASNEPILYVDDVHLGRARNVGSVAQAQLVGSILWPKTANCLWTRTSNSTFASFSADADCTTPTGSQLVGSAIAPATKIPAISFSNLSPARYMVVSQGAFNSGGVYQCGFSITDGTRRTTPIYASSSGTAGQITGFIDISTPTSSTTTFEIQASGNGTNGECQVNNTPNNPDMGDMSIQVYRFPSSSEIAVRPELLANSWSGYHDTDCSWTTTSASYADPGNDASCTFAQKTNNNFGTVTTAGASTPGIVWTPKKTGNYFVCTDTTFRNSVATATLGAQLTDGSAIVAGPSLQNSSVNGSDQGLSFCGIYNVTSLSSVTLKLQFKINTGTLTVNGTNGTRTSWSIFAIDQSIPAPVLVGSVTSQSTGAEREERISFAGNTSGSNACTASPCTISSQSGNWVTSVTRGGTGNYTVNFASGVFASAPTCVCIPSGVVGNTFCFGSASGFPTTSSATFNIVDAGNTARDDSIQIRCMGPRGNL